MDGQRVLKRLQAGDGVAELVIGRSPPGRDVAGIRAPDAVAIAVLVTQPKPIFPEGDPGGFGKSTIVIEGAGVVGAAGPGDAVGVDAIDGDECITRHHPVPDVVVASGYGDAAAAVGGGAARDIEELVAADGERLFRSGDGDLTECGDGSAAIHRRSVVLSEPFALLDLARQAYRAVLHVIQAARTDIFGRCAVVDAVTPRS